jgi:hypothetical protein
VEVFLPASVTVSLSVVSSLFEYNFEAEQIYNTVSPIVVSMRLLPWKYISLKLCRVTGVHVTIYIFIYLYFPRMEAGKNTSTVIPASRKRRRTGNRISLRETVPADLREA